MNRNPEYTLVVRSDAHVLDRLAEYFSGSLPAADEPVVDGHLVRCEECRHEYDELGEVALILALKARDMPPHARAALVARAPRPRSPHTGATRPGSHRAGGSGPGNRGPGDSWPGSSGPGGTPRRRLRVIAGYVAVLAVGALFGIGGVLIANRPTSPPLRTAGETQDPAANQLTVAVVARADGGTDIRAAAVGLRPGQEFLLVAVTVDGTGFLAARGIAGGGVEPITDIVPVAPAQVAFVVLSESGNGALLVARPT